MTNNTLRTARLSAGYTQESLGIALGYDKSCAGLYVRRWELGLRPIPRGKLKKLCELLTLDPFDLL